MLGDTGDNFDGGLAVKISKAQGTKGLIKAGIARRSTEAAKPGDGVADRT